MEIERARALARKIADVAPEDVGTVCAAFALVFEASDDEFLDFLNDDLRDHAYMDRFIKSVGF